MDQSSQIQESLALFTNRSMALQGCDLVSGAITITGLFYGLSIGSTKPDSLKITPVANKIKLNGTALASTDDIINFVSEGEFIPIEFTSITLTGAGYVKCYSK